MKINPVLLLLGLHHLRTTSSSGTLYHFVEGNCYEWVGTYTPHMSDNDWAKVLAFHGGAARLVTDRNEQFVSFQQVSSTTRDGMIGVLTKPNYLVGLETQNLMVTWTITGVCG